MSATPAPASARPCHTSNVLGLLHPKGKKLLTTSSQACLSKARSATATQTSGQGTKLVHPVNLRRSPKVVPSPQPSAWHSRIAELYIPENLECSRDPVLTSSVPSPPHAYTPVEI
eukprot:42797-Chlamydomonas_euryale.AAC.3